MAKIIYNNTTVVVDDPQERFKMDEEMTVTIKKDSQTKELLVRVPEKKEVSNEPKPQPTKVFDGVLSGIKGTITVKGNLKVNMDIPPKKAVAVGYDTLKQDLNEALNKVWNHGRE